MCNQMLGNDFQSSRLAQYSMIVKTIVAQKLVQEQLNFPVLQAFHLNLVSFGRNAALDSLDMFPEKVYSNASFVGKFSEVYDLLLLLRLSNGF